MDMPWPTVLIQEVDLVQLTTSAPHLATSPSQSAAAQAGQNDRMQNSWFQSIYGTADSIATVGLLGILAENTCAREASGTVSTPEPSLEPLPELVKLANLVDLAASADPEVIASWYWMRA